MKLRFSTDSYRDILLRVAKDNSLYPRPDCEPWLQEIATAFRNDLGLLALHSISGLSEQLPGQPLVRIPLCAVDNLILLLTRDAVQSRRHIGIALPTGTVMLPMLMICKTLLGDLLSQQEMLTDPHRPLSLKERGGILLVSPDTEMRTRYFSMRVGEATVDKVYPACRMRPDGSVAPITASPEGVLSVCFFLAHLKRLPDPGEVKFKPAVVILDLTHDHWIDRLEDIIGWCTRLHDTQGEPTTIIAILPLGDRPMREALARQDIPTFPLNADAINSIVEGFSSIAPPSTAIEREAYSTWSFSSFALEKPLERAHTIYCVPEQAASDVVEIVTDIYQALDSADNLNDRHVHSGRHPDLRLASWLVGTLLQLPVPAQWYEQHAFLAGNRQTLKKLIGSIGTGPHSSLNREIAPILQSVRGQLDLLYMRLSTANPKSEAFLRYYQDYLAPRLAEEKEVVVLARNDVVARALWPWLQSEGVPIEHQARLRILTYKQIDGRELYDIVVATGPWPYRYRWQVGGRLGRNIDFILYDREEGILKQQVAYFYGQRARKYLERERFSILQGYSNLHAIPPDETLAADDIALILNRIGRVPTYDELADAQVSTPGTSKLGLEEEDEQDGDLPSIFSVHRFDPATFTIRPPLPRSNLGEAFQEQGEASSATSSALIWREDRIAEMDNQPDLGDADAPINAEHLGGPTEACLRLTMQLLSMGPPDEEGEVRYLYLSSEASTECYLPGGEEALASILNDEIEPGYIIIRTDQEDRDSLFDRIIQMADAQPTMKYLKVWRTYWLEAADSLVRKGAMGQAVRGSYKQLQTQLAQSGVQVTTMTVRDWVLGARIGPRDIKAVKAVGALTQHPMLMQYPDQVDAAFKQIRVIHQLLGRRIAATLQRLGKVASQGLNRTSGRNDYTSSSGIVKRGKRNLNIDPALAVPIDDLLDLLEFWEVLEVSQDPCQVPSSRVGKLLTRSVFG
ncbi:MAG TPA: DrmE family protein [Chloroflexia bacterium]|nr:DrmE family protein [Chloroflexia bacterium]